MVGFCSSVQKSHWLPILCYKSRLGVDFKVIISSTASQEKEKKLCMAIEEMGATTFNSR